MSILDGVKYCREYKTRKGVEIAILNRMIRGGCNEMTFKPNPEKDEGGNYVDMKERSIPGRINSKCKRPEATSYLVH